MDALFKSDKNNSEPVMVSRNSAKEFTMNLAEYYYPLSEGSYSSMPAVKLMIRSIKAVAANLPYSRLRLCMIISGMKILYLQLFATLKKCRCI